MEDINGSNGAVATGNTNSVATTDLSKRISPSKNWCFTLNNYDEKDIKDICSNGAIKFYIIGKEMSSTGTPHLQGYIEFNKKVRPLSVFKRTDIHWEKTRGTQEDNYNYCSKEGNFISNIPRPEPIKIIQNLRPWQEAIEKIILEQPDDRSIHWFWEPNGNMGKSAFVKYLCVKYGALVLSNKACDMKYGIIQFMEKNNGIAPKIIIIDIPRSVEAKFISYTGFEEVKNGCYFSPKYESRMVLFNAPHFLVFANEEPLIEEMSADRWKITLIE